MQYFLRHLNAQRSDELSHVLNSAYKQLESGKFRGSIPYGTLFERSLLPGSTSYRYIGLTRSVEELNYEVLAYLLSVQTDFDIALAVLREGCYAARLRVIRVLRTYFSSKNTGCIPEQLLAICEVALDQAAHLALERLAELFAV